jgi:hypothetical protein
MDGALKDMIIQVLSVARLLSVDILIGMKLKPKGRRIWTANSTKTDKNDLMTEALQSENNDFYEENYFKGEILWDDDKRLKEKQSKDETCWNLFSGRGKIEQCEEESKISSPSDGERENLEHGSKLGEFQGQADNVKKNITNQ